jgi:anaerobic magnesium-protoporphyrin IX monomethyl ester cyclase
MKILLINPSLVQAEIGHYSKKTEEKRGIYPPLGLCYIATALEKENHEVRIIDCDAENNYFLKIDEAVSGFKPELVGFYIMTWTFRAANEIARKIKSLIPDIKLVAGGPGITCMPEESLEYGEFDFAVIGEGEITAVDLVKALEKGENDFGEILGLAYKQNGKIKINNPRPLIENLDSVPFPSRYLLPVKKYFDVLTRKRHFATIIATRGCPFNCTFCDRKNRMGRDWRVRTPENIVDEIEEVKSKYGIKEFMFFDDNLIVDKDWSERLCAEILKRNLKIIWECRARADRLLDKNLLKRLKQAGCYRIRIGFEAGDNEILKVLKKGITAEQSLQCAKICKEVGMEMVGYFMMGSPEETRETIQKTLDLALKINPDFAVFSKTIIIPGSELFDWAVENNKIRRDYWQRFLKGEEANGAPAISTKELPEEEVSKLVAMANKKFYARLGYMLKRLFGIRSLTQFIRQFQMGMTLILNKFS